MTRELPVLLAVFACIALRRRGESGERPILLTAGVALVARLALPGEPVAAASAALNALTCCLLVAFSKQAKHCYPLFMAAAALDSAMVGTLAVTGRINDDALVALFDQSACWLMTAILWSRLLSLHRSNSRTAG